MCPYDSFSALVQCYAGRKRSHCNLDRMKWPSSRWIWDAGGGEFSQIQLWT